MCSSIPTLNYIWDGEKMDECDEKTGQDIINKRNNS